MKKMLKTGVIFLSTLFYTSCAPTAFLQFLSRHFPLESLKTKRWTGAGFIGSLWGALTYWVLPFHWANSIWLILGAVILSVIISQYAEKYLGNHDDSRIVIDEWAGCWIALWGLPQELGVPFVMAFVLFRIFDVLKGPWGNYVQKWPGGLGITMDDVLAGLVANGLTRLYLAFF